MENGMENLRKLFDSLKTFTLWDRLFHWGRIRSLLIETSAELQRLVSGIDSLRSENSKLEGLIDRATNDKTDLQKEISTLKEKNDNYLKRGTELANEMAATKQKLEHLEQENRRLRDETTQYKTFEEQRRQDHNKAVVNFQKLSDQLMNERKEEKEKRVQQEIDRIKRLKETWVKHEETVASRIKTICNKHAVEYLDKVPFKGKPDNTIQINGEYIIFDAKSPAGEDLSNFPLYLKTQAESVSKYVKEEGVRREIFLVVPANTLEILNQFEFRLSDYTVYIVSIDSLEPIILMLRKIEDYEFAEQLSPEERENICRVFGKFVHLSKRRIQIDGFFAKQFFELVYRSEADLPKDFLDKVIEFEKAEKLNPPIERRSRQISNKELEIEIRERKTDAEQKGIEMDESMLSKNLNKLPLYTDKPSEETQKDLFE
jgi:predicted  nucleic acid-binding Zn-ribbon protein